MSDKTTLSLPEQLDIGQVESIRVRMNKTLAKDAANIEVKTEKVDHVDSAGMQLLLSFRAAAINSGKAVTLIKPSDEFLAAAELLGTSELLELG